MCVFLYVVCVCDKVDAAGFCPWEEARIIASFQAESLKEKETHRLDIIYGIFWLMCIYAKSYNSLLKYITPLHT